jgi:hypothetical protein
LWACSSSWSDVDLLKVETPESRAPAELGTVVHAGLAAFVRTGSLVEASAILDELTVSSEIDLNADETAQLLEVGVNAWPEFGIKEAQIEHPLVGENLSGHIDILAFAGDSLTLLDWKSGWRDCDYNPQMRGYAYLAWVEREFPDPFEIDTRIVWLRQRVMDSETYHADDIRAWQVEYLKKLADIGKTETPGEHCGYCPRSHECDSYRHWLRGGCRAIMAGCAKLQTRGEMARARAYVAPLEKALKVFKARCKAEVQARGPLDTGDGYEYRLTVSYPEKILADVGWTVFLEYLNYQQLAECITVVKDKLQKAVGKDKWPECHDALVAAGAIRRGEVQVLRRCKHAE